MNSKTKKSNKQNSVEHKKKSSQKFLVLSGILFGIFALFLARSPFISVDFDKNVDCGSVDLPPVVPLEGNLKPNHKLEKAVYIGQHVLVGPETIEFDKDGFLYTGLLNGQIVKIDPTNPTEFQIIAQIGTESQEKCKKLKEHPIAECGRPLGLRIKPNSSDLYVADSYLGIFKINLKTGLKTLVLSSSDKIFGERPMKMLNDLDFDGDIIYFIDSSYVRPVSDAILEHSEKRPRGRLFLFNEKTKEFKQIKDALYFPNGLQMMPDKQSILINENSMARVIKYFIKGERKDQMEIFAVIPGYGDTIRLTDKNTLLVPFATYRGGLASVVEFLNKWPLVRNFLGSVINLKYLLKVAPKYGLIAEYDLNGKPLKSWHDPSGLKVECTTAGAIYNNKLYLGSFYNDFLAVVDYD